MAGFSFRLIGRRTKKWGSQIQRSHSIPFVLTFYVLILVYYRAKFMEIFLLYLFGFGFSYLWNLSWCLAFVTFWYFF